MQLLEPHGPHVPLLGPQALMTSGRKPAKHTMSTGPVSDSWPRKSASLVPRQLHFPAVKTRRHPHAEYFHSHADHLQRQMTVRIGKFFT